MCDHQDTRSRSRSRSRDRGSPVNDAATAPALDSLILDAIFSHQVDDAGASALAVALLNDAARAVRAGDAARGVAFAGAARRCCWDALHAGDWRSAPDWARSVYALAAALESALVLAAARVEVVDHTRDALERDARRGLDVALLLCPPGGAALSPRALVHAILAAAPLPRAARQPQPLPTLPRSLADSIAVAAEEAGAARGRRAVPRLELPTLRSFLEAASQGPVVVVGTIEHWPALASADRRWENLSRLESVLHGRVAPVEVGAHYLAADWRESLTPLDA